jgi:hypothetical protein
MSCVSVDGQRPNISANLALTFRFLDSKCRAIRG